MPPSEKNLHIKKPSWLKTPIPKGKVFFDIKRDLRGRKLFTVCEEAKCPNISECWSSKTATFMIGGEICTRACRFCNVKTGNPGGLLDLEEPGNVAQSCDKMDLKYVVITMVDRDDLKDGGCGHFIKVFSAVKDQNPGIKIEFLSGDFSGDEILLEKILLTRLEVFAHNIETVRRLTPRVRDARASYEQSLRVLDFTSKYKHTKSLKTYIKSSIMLGLGEEKAEVHQTLNDLRSSGVDFVTLGQYMRPTKKHLAIKKWVTPDEFAEYGRFARKIGFKGVVSNPLVRSSYKAREFYEKNSN